MFENAANLSIRPGMIPESLRIIQEAIIPVLLKQPGLLSLALIPHPESSVITILSIWKTSAFARGAEINPQYWQAVGRLENFIQAPLADHHLPTAQPTTGRMREVSPN